MNDAFREQLLKAGLATKKQVKAAAHEENVGRRKRRGKKKGTADAAPELALAAAALEEKRIRDKALNEEREAARKAAALVAEVDDLVSKNRIRDIKGDVAYKFSHDNTIKTLYVTATFQRALADGTHGIVVSGGGYCVVPREAALKIEERVPARLLVLNEPDDSDEDDPYKIPDDLMW